MIWCATSGPRRTRNHIVLPNWTALVSEPKLTFSFKDEKHLFLAVVAVKRTLNLAWREDRQVVTQLLGTDAVADLAPAGRVDAVRFNVIKRNFIEIYDWLASPYRSPYVWFVVVRPPNPVNVAASVRARPLNVSKMQGVDFNQGLVRFAL